MKSFGEKKKLQNKKNSKIENVGRHNTWIKKCINKYKIWGLCGVEKIWNDSLQFDNRTEENENTRFVCKREKGLRLYNKKDWKARKKELEKW